MPTIVIEVGRFTDTDGYTSEIVAIEGGIDGRPGQTFIVSPEGERLATGYWMDFPERGWTHNGVDLFEDYCADKERSVWRRLPLAIRLQMEAKQQATAYGSLRQQFLTRKDLNRELREVRAMMPVLEEFLFALKSGGIILTPDERAKLDALHAVALDCLPPQQ